jgi:hypothetical protein
MASSRNVGAHLEFRRNVVAQLGGVIMALNRSAVAQLEFRRVLWLS